MAESSVALRIPEASECRPEAIDRFLRLLMSLMHLAGTRMARPNLVIGDRIASGRENVDGLGMNSRSRARSIFYTRCGLCFISLVVTPLDNYDTVNHHGMNWLTDRVRYISWGLRNKSTNRLGNHVHDATSKIQCKQSRPRFIFTSRVSVCMHLVTARTSSEAAFSHLAKVTHQRKVLGGLQL